MNNVQLEDCKALGALNYIDWDRFRDSTILVTGSTGLIGVNLVNAIAYNSQAKELNIKLILPVRNKESAIKMFDWTAADIRDYKLEDGVELDTQVDYIVHLASPTSSLFFSENPVDTLLSNFRGAAAILNAVKDTSLKKLVFLSTMEVYGLPSKGHSVKEEELGSFETMNSRNSYPISKIAVENLCYSYYSQNGVRSVVLRATQTFGPGVKYDDGRVFAQFMRCAIENKDIVLKTQGLTERCYLYTADAVSAILTALLKAEPGNAYTVANPSTYCSIKDMAAMVSRDIAQDKISVVYDVVDDIGRFGYAETLYMDLNVDKLMSLGWKPTTDLENMFRRMIRGLQ